MNAILSNEVDEEMLENLVKTYNELEEKGGNLHIFLASQGGDVTIGEAIIELINRYQPVTTVTAYGVLASMGFKIFADVKCVKTVLNSAFAIVHLSRWGTQILEGGKPLDDFARFKEANMKKGLKKSLTYYANLGFSEKEVDDLKQGKDLFLDSDRLKKMFK